MPLPHVYFCVKHGKALATQQRGEEKPSLCGLIDSDLFCYAGPGALLSLIPPTRFQSRSVPHARPYPTTTRAVFTLQSGAGRGGASQGTEGRGWRCGRALPRGSGAAARVLSAAWGSRSGREPAGGAERSGPAASAAPEKRGRAPAGGRAGCRRGCQRRGSGPGSRSGTGRRLDGKERRRREAMGEQQSSLSAPRAAAAAPPSPAGRPREDGPEETPPLREAAGLGGSGEPPPSAGPERRGGGGDAAGEDEEETAGPETPGVGESAEEGPEGGSGRRRPARRHVYCTVYCVENDRPGPGSPPGPGSAQPPARRGVAAGGDPLSAGGSIEVVDLYLLPEPFSGLIGGDFGPLLVLSCRVCLEEKPVKPLSCCKKAVCEECLKRYLSSQVRPGPAPLPEGIADAVVPLSPSGSCRFRVGDWVAVPQPLSMG